MLPSVLEGWGYIRGDIMLIESNIQGDVNNFFSD